MRLKGDGTKMSQAQAFLQKLRTFQITDSQKKYLIFLGCVMMITPIALHNHFGNLLPYLASYYHHHPARFVKGVDPLWVITCYQMFTPLGVFLSSYVERAIGMHKSLVAGVVLVCASILASFYTVREPVALAASFGALNGVGSGALFTLCWKLLPRWLGDRRGLATGIMSAGPFVGSLVLIPLTFLVLNPENEWPAVEEDHVHYFADPMVLDRVPRFFLMLGFCCVAVLGTGLILVQVEEPVEIDELHEPNDPSPMEIEMQYFSINSDDEVAVEQNQQKQQQQQQQEQQQQQKRKPLQRASSLSAKEKLTDSSAKLYGTLNGGEDVVKDHKHHAFTAQTDTPTENNARPHGGGRKNSTSAEPQEKKWKSTDRLIPRDDVSGFSEEMDYVDLQEEHERQLGGKVASETSLTKFFRGIFSRPSSERALDMKHEKSMMDNLNTAPGSKTTTASSSSNGHRKSIEPTDSEDDPTHDVLWEKKPSSSAKKSGELKPSVSRKSSGAAPEVEMPLYTPRLAVRTRAFWQIWLIFLLLGHTTYVHVNLYKQYGHKAIHNDGLLVFTGMLALAAALAVRPFWGWFADRHGVKLALVLVCAASNFFMTFVPVTLTRSTFLFVVFVALEFSAVSSSYSLVNQATLTSFGPAHSPGILLLVYTSQVLVVFLEPFLLPPLIADAGWEYAFLTAMVSAALAFGIALTWTQPRRQLQNKK